MREASEIIFKDYDGTEIAGPLFLNLQTVSMKIVQRQLTFEIYHMIL